MLPDGERQEDDADVEVVDALPVPANGAGHVEAPAPPRSLLPASPAGQAAVVAASSFVAGAATIAVVRAHRSRKVAKRARKARGALGPILASRSFLVDVHLLGSRD